MALPAIIAGLAGRAGSLLGKVGAVAGSANFFPSYEEETIVAVHGSPNASMGDLFNQAIAIAFGQTKVVFLDWLPTPFVADAQYDMMNKSVTVTLRYMFSGIMSQTSQALPLGTRTKFVDRFFSDPPADNIVGGQPNNKWFADVIAASALPAAAKLRDATSSNQVVGYGVQADINAGAAIKPNGIINLADNGTRGNTFLEKLVLNSLGVECSVTDAWKSIRNKPAAAMPGVPSASGVSVSGNANVGTLTGTTQEIYNTLTSGDSGQSSESELIASQMAGTVLDIYTELISGAS